MYSNSYSNQAVTSESGRNMGEEILLVSTRFMCTIPIKKKDLWLKFPLNYVTISYMCSEPSFFLKKKFNL